MKRIKLTFLLGLIGYVCNAQIYSRIMYCDKFDDVVKSENVKTLITQTDSTFIIEVKGREPVEYWISSKIKEASKGDKENIVDLTEKNVYGYEECWAVFEKKDKDKYLYQLDNIISNKEEALEIFTKKSLYIIHRTISRYSYKYEYENDYFWIQDYSNDNRLGNGVFRIIYLN